MHPSAQWTPLAAPFTCTWALRQCSTPLPPPAPPCITPTHPPPLTRGCCNSSAHSPPPSLLTVLMCDHLCRCTCRFDPSPPCCFSCTAAPSHPLHPCILPARRLLPEPRLIGQTCLTVQLASSKAGCVVHLTMPSLLRCISPRLLPPRVLQNLSSCSCSCRRRRRCCHWAYSSSPPLPLPLPLLPQPLHA